MRSTTELRRLAEDERKMARRPQVIELCDAVLELTVVRAPKPEKPKTDRKAYMREFMRKRRAADKVAREE